MTKTIIDVLKLININKETPYQGIATTFSINFSIDFRQQSAAIKTMCQWISAGMEMKLFL
ncbi:hypothetical protein AND4_19522 [Vibrio sp. AND4]|nr:hypothetical protein AND4_19522 [Vibrio sp. AND4]